MFHNQSGTHSMGELALKPPFVGKKWSQAENWPRPSYLICRSPKKKPPLIGHWETLFSDHQT